MIIIGELEYHFADAVKAIEAYQQLDSMGLLSVTTSIQLMAKIRRTYKRELMYIKKHCQDVELKPGLDIEDLIMSLP